MAEDEGTGSQEVADEVEESEDIKDPAIMTEADIVTDALSLEGKEDEGKDTIVKDKGYQELSEKMADLEAKVQKVEADKKNLQKALHEERQSKKKAKQDDPEEAVLSDVDLAKIIQEHKDDPAVLLNAVNYKVQQAIKKGKTETIDEVQTKQRATLLNNALRGKFGDLLDDESSDLRVSINKAKDFLNMTDHPFGDAIGAAAVVFDQLPTIQKLAYDKGVKDALDGKVEKNRVSGIEKGKSLFTKRTTDGGQPKDKDTGATESQIDTARRLGFKPGTPQFKTYMNQIAKTKAA